MSPAGRRSLSNGVEMSRFGISLAALTIGVGGAYAADLPTKKEAPAPEPSCFSSFMAYLDSTPSTCPLTWNGITLYGTIDMGGGYETHGVPFNRDMHTGVEELISKNSQGGMWQLTPGGLSQSQVGVKINEPIAQGWSFVAQAGLGFDPYALSLSNGPYAQSQNTFLPLQFQSANADSSRAGQWDNSVGFVGVSNKTFGTLTVGRQNTLTLDAVNSYDPMGGSYAFSPIGFSGKVAGAGGTEDARQNTSVRYNVDINNFRLGALVQFGGYAQGNGSNGEYEGQVGATFNNLSVDAIYSYIKDQVNLGTYNKAEPSYIPSDALTATLSDNNSVMLVAKYKIDKATLFGGWEYIRYSNPSDSYSWGFYSIGNFPVPANTAGVTSVTSTAYTVPLNFNAFWAGVKYSFTDKLDGTLAGYLYNQADYNPTACTANTTAPAPGYSPQGTNSGKCQGNLYAVSVMLDYHVFKRLDIYGGAMYSAVTGGLASGFLNTNNFDPTVGIRVQF
jgi:predicted porin